MWAAFAKIAAQVAINYLMQELTNSGSGGNENGSAARRGRIMIPPERDDGGQMAQLQQLMTLLSTSGRGRQDPQRNGEIDILMEILRGHTDLPMMEVM